MGRWNQIGASLVLAAMPGCGGEVDAVSTGPDEVTADASTFEASDGPNGQLPLEAGDEEPVLLQPDSGNQDALIACMPGFGLTGGFRVEGLSSDGDLNVDMSCVISELALDELPLRIALSDCGPSGSIPEELVLLLDAATTPFMLAVGAPVDFRYVRSTAGQWFTLRSDGLALLGVEARTIVPTTPFDTSPMTLSSFDYDDCGKTLDNGCGTADRLGVVADYGEQSVGAEDDIMRCSEGELSYCILVERALRYNNTCAAERPHEFSFILQRMP